MTEKIQDETNVSIITDKLSKLPKPKKGDEGDEGYAEYVQVCKELDFKEQEVVYCNGDIRGFTVVKSEFKYFLAESKYPAKALMTLLGSHEAVNSFMKYTLKKHNLKTKPSLHKYCYVTNSTSANEEGFRFRSDLQPFSNDFDKWTETASNMQWTFDREICAYNCYIPTLPISRSNNDLINKYLKVTFGENLQSIMDWISIYTFENRYGISRPALCLSGDRGTGKSVFLEKFISQIYPGMSAEVNLSEPKFTEWKTAKLAHIGELTESNHRTDQIWDISKQISGDGVSNTNTKYGQIVDIRNGTFLVILTNEVKPFHIKDPIINEEFNHILVIKMEKTLKKDKAINDVMNAMHELGYKDFSDFFADNLGHWIYTELFNHYKNLKKRIKGKLYRYGMPVPITSGLEEIIQLSVTNIDQAIMRCLEDLYYQNGDIYGFNEIEWQMFKMFSMGTASGMRGFIPQIIVNKMAQKRDFDFFSLTRFLRKNKWLVTDNMFLNPLTADSYGRKYYGLVLNIKKLDNFLTEQHEETQRKIAEIQSKEEFKSTFVPISDESSILKEPVVKDKEETVEDLEELERLFDV